MKRFTRVRPRTLVAVAVAAAFAMFFVTAALGDDDPQPVDFAHNVTGAPAPVAGAVFGNGSPVKAGTAICTTPTQTTTNVNTDCEATTAGPGPHNETSIAVNPTDTNNIIGGVNDYQLGVNPGGHITETIASRAHVTFDGGKTWSQYAIKSNSAYQATGDPSLAFDDSGRAYYATLGFRFVGPTAQNPDVTVSTSTDKGKTWSEQVVAHGSGNATSVGDLLDKEYVTAWGNGNAIVTFGDFRLGQKGSFVSAQIYDSVTHDGGQTWSAPQVISGSLDEAFVSVPAITSDRSTAYVSFLNTTDLATGRDDYEVVRVDPTTGARTAGPFKVATVIDGATDYPIAFGRQTYQDSLFRSWAAGNVTVDPTNGNHIALVWSDMRNSTVPAPSNPYAAKTNSDVVVSDSVDGGQTWSAPTALALPGDQWTPWGAFDAAGNLRIGFFDRSYDAANHQYGFTLATRSGGSYSYTPVTTQLSDPTKNDRWFAATANPAFPFATTFLGDYPNIAIIPGTTHVVEYWTDMRVPATFAGVTRQGEDAFFAKVG